MKIEILEKSEDVLKFIIRDINGVIANTVRRTIMSEVPTMAIKQVTFSKNESAMYDEILAHRIGLVPIKTDYKSFNLPKDCKCKGEGCSLCQLEFSLKEKGEKTVYSQDLKSTDKKITAAIDNIPLVKLLKGQKLEIEAIATMGIGGDHAKYSPGIAYYQEYPEIKIKDPKNVEEIMKNCPQDVFKVSGKKIEINDILKCTLCGACEEIAENEGVEVNPSETDFIFTIESWGQLTPKEILTTALDILSKKCAEFEKGVEKL